MQIVGIHYINYITTIVYISEFSAIRLQLKVPLSLMLRTGNTIIAMAEEISLALHRSFSFILFESTSVT